MAPWETVDVSVPAQWIRPNGSRSRRPYFVSVPGVRWAIEQPRVHSSLNHAVSTKSTGLAAFGPNRAVSLSMTACRRSSGSSVSTFCATGPNVKDAITPGEPDAGDASRVVSDTDPGSELCALYPSPRQNGSSYTTSVFDSGPGMSLRYSV